MLNIWLLLRVGNLIDVGKFFADAPAEIEGCFELFFQVHGVLLFDSPALDFLEHAYAELGLVDVDAQERDESAEELVTVREEAYQHRFLEWVKHHSARFDQLLNYLHINN